GRGSPRPHPERGKSRAREASGPCPGGRGGNPVENDLLRSCRRLSSAVRVASRRRRAERADAGVVQAAEPLLPRATVWATTDSEGRAGPRCTAPRRTPLAG